jgi:hypothetical protein
MRIAMDLNEGNRGRSRGDHPMCDYSLDFVASRPAKVGDKLVSTHFHNSITRGFAPVGEPGVAVCLLPGTELAFEKDVEYEPQFHLFHQSEKIVAKVAQFRRVNPNKRHAHHDALEFPGGQIVLLTRLRPDQVATVLQLPAGPAKQGHLEEESRLLVAGLVA